MTITQIPLDESIDLTVQTLSEQSLEDLAAVVHRENDRAVKAGIQTLQHAVLAGVALNEAHSRIDPAKWVDWVESTGISVKTANTYRRIAMHHDALKAAGATGINEAKEFLAYYPRLPGAYASNRAPEQVRKEAQQLHTDGASVPEIAALLDRGVATVRRWVDPDAARKKRESDKRYKKRRAAATRALREQEERNALAVDVKSTGGDLAKAYSFIRQTAAAIDRAAGQCANRDDAKALRATLAHIYKVEDEISRVIRSSK